MLRWQNKVDWMTNNESQGGKNEFLPAHRLWWGGHVARVKNDMSHPKNVIMVLNHSRSMLISVVVFPSKSEARKCLKNAKTRQNTPRSIETVFYPTFTLRRDALSLVWGIQALNGNTETSLTEGTSWGYRRFVRQLAFCTSWLALQSDNRAQSENLNQCVCYADWSLHS